MLREVGLNQLVERESARDARLPSKPLELPLERVTRVGLRGEPASLNTLRPAAASSVAVRPQPLLITPAAPQLEDLSLLHHPGISSFQESTPSHSDREP